MDISYRFADLNDIEAIVSIENDVMSCPWSEASFREAIDSEHAFVMVACDSDVLIGYSVVYMTTPESELPDIVINRNYWHKGIGSGLLEETIKYAASRGIETMFLEVRKSNENAHLMYLHHGFEDIGIRKYFYSNPVEDAVCMRLDLNTSSGLKG